MAKTQTAKKQTARKPSPSLKLLVGDETYRVWTEMLHELVPDGRTHRLAPLIAGMLQYAAGIAWDKYRDHPEQDPVAQALLDEDVNDAEDANEIMALVTRLFKDVGVEHKRVSAAGDKYSVAESAVYEFIHWFDMPWDS